MKRKKERKVLIKRGNYCGADGQPCCGICRKVNSEKGTCECQFQFDAEADKRLEV